MYFFEFEDGRNILVEEDNLNEAMKTIDETWYQGIFEEQNFKVTHVKGSSLKTK